jgi:predicted DNA-binding ribbon-helix-helix protein
LRNGDSYFQNRRTSAVAAAGESNCPSWAVVTGPVKRSIMIAGHATSISLESVFWEALREAAAAEGLPLNALVARIDAERIQARPAPNLASAIRVWLFARSRR